MEIFADLPRGNVYIAGETLECRVSFRCLNPRDGEQPSTSHGPASLTAPNPGHLAWASAQINCHCTVSDAKVRLFPSTSPSGRAGSSTGKKRGSSTVTSTNSSSDMTLKTAVVAKDTSFVPTKGEGGRCALSTAPKILFCDLKLQPGEVKTFSYYEKLPFNCVPSYQGNAVKYIYKITIGAQRVNAPIKMLRVPFKVLVVNGLGDMVALQQRELQAREAAASTEEAAAGRPANPFKAELQKTAHSAGGDEDFGSVLDVAVQLLDMIAGRKNPYSYNISNSKGKVGQFCLYKQSFRIGEDIIGTFDFSESTIPCVQFLVTLQCVEEVAAEHRRQHAPAASSSASAAGAHVTAYSKSHEFCLHVAHTHVVLPVPYTVYPSFATDLVSVKWNLHFEFVTSSTEIETPLSTNVPVGADQSTIWQGPHSLQVETMVWDLPVKVVPTNPIVVSCAAAALRTAPPVCLV